MAGKPHLASITHESTNERLGHHEPVMYESYMTTIMCVIMVVFSIACVLIIIFIAMSLTKHEKAAVKKKRVATEVIIEERSGTDREEAVAPPRPPACSQPMYFRCLNGSDYDRGEWVFVRRDHGSRRTGAGSCRRWQPDKVCARDSPAHFRKRQDCVRACEARRDKRCLGLVTERFLKPCSDSPEDRPRRFWHYDRVRRACVRWTPAITCAYNAFRSSGQCKIVCMLPHRRRG